MSIVREYLDESGTGYVIEQHSLGYRWAWKEPGEPDELGPMVETLAGALRSAAADWDSNGNIADKRAAVLKRAATVAERGSADT